eukprot:804815-Pelagomonas_calceolata.AAC.5
MNLCYPAHHPREASCACAHLSAYPKLPIPERPCHAFVPVYIKQVTEASQGSTSPAPAASHAASGSSGVAEEQPAEGSSGRDQEGVWVVVELYKPGQAASARMSPCIDELAARYPSTKFVRIVSTDCIPKVSSIHDMVAAKLLELLVYIDAHKLVLGGKMESERGKNE